ncbi:hypothetical protein QAD02_013000 [Eretmocerus hayati]|uniref:Uncharacterized protein n=1 Tax=Eretmocerus hayati TaxID=131215 RepID=A0ACC2P172_9HYME|nr:hypothetical protein QAD02_013000 [Eretmocerus hayati]
MKNENPSTYSRNFHDRSPHKSNKNRDRNYHEVSRVHDYVKPGQNIESNHHYNKSKERDSMSDEPHEYDSGAECESPDEYLNIDHRGLFETDDSRESSPTNQGQRNLRENGGHQNESIKKSTKFSDSNDVQYQSPGPSSSDYLDEPNLPRRNIWIPWFFVLKADHEEEGMSTRRR